jgi:hypothetical protein
MGTIKTASKVNCRTSEIFLDPYYLRRIIDLTAKSVLSAAAHYLLDDSCTERSYWLAVTFDTSRGLIGGVGAGFLQVQDEVIN